MNKDIEAWNRLKPILFSTQMVQAILENRKTQTRRIVKPQPWKQDEFSGNPKGIEKAFWREDHQEWWFTPKDVEEYDPSPYSLMTLRCPYGQPGDILWVREGFRIDVVQDRNGVFHDVPLYKSDFPDEHPKILRWKPSIHMPYTACRIWLKIKSIRVERLQDISEHDAIEEGGVFTDNGICDSWPNHITKEQAAKTGGLKGGWSHIGETHPDKCLRSARTSFGNLWEKINGEKSWNANPWVWVVEFDKTEQPK